MQRTYRNINRKTRGNVFSATNSYQSSYHFLHLLGTLLYLILACFSSIDNLFLSGDECCQFREWGFLLSRADSHVLYDDADVDILYEMGADKMLYDAK